MRGNIEVQIGAHPANTSSFCTVLLTPQGKSGERRSIVARRE